MKPQRKWAKEELEETKGRIYNTKEAWWNTKVQITISKKKLCFME